jgi:dihydroorotate dehydrogenase
LSTIDAVALPILSAFAPETAHRIAISALKLRRPRPCSSGDPRLIVTAFGLTFPNPLGLAAGFDKNGEVSDPLLSLGFGFIEIGTVTPGRQNGNPRPRLFRLPQDAALINRLGFNNDGHHAVHARLLKRRLPGILGVNIGANKDAVDRRADYIAGIVTFVDVASYFTINISSPNTPGLRDLHQAAALDDLLARLIDARDGLADRFGGRPLLLKISPDLTLPDLDDVVRVARKRRIDGLIVSNTTVVRPRALLNQSIATESGGLSGRPLFGPSTRMLALTYQRVENQFPLIGVGGISDAATAFQKICAGASLLQVYSGFVFRGTRLIGEINKGLTVHLSRAGHRHLSRAVGSAAAAWANESAAAWAGG